MENNADVRLKKIPLEHLIDILVVIYEQGVEYIDIVGTNNVEQDSLGIIYSQDYMRKEEGDEEESSSDGGDVLNNDDLNQLI